MKIKRCCIYFLVIIVIGWSSVNAQEAAVPAGGNAIGSAGSVSYSVGQINYTEITGPSGSSIQGVQQPYEISVVTGVDKSNRISLSATVYPNPAKDILTLSVTETDFNKLSFQMYDTNGKLLFDDHIFGSQTEIRMDGLAPSVYILKVMQIKTELKSFKIIKR